MINHHTKNKGDLGVLKAKCDLFQKGYYLNPSDFGKSVTLRVETPKNNQKKSVNLASDYREVP
jgi:hypothetical protein